MQRYLHPMLHRQPAPSIMPLKAAMWKTLSYDGWRRIEARIRERKKMIAERKGGAGASYGGHLHVGPSGRRVLA
jgi:hypothetical protein